MGHSVWTDLVKKYHDKLGGPLKNSMKAAAKSPEWKAHKTLTKTKKRGGTPNPVVGGGDEVEVKAAEPVAEPVAEPAVEPVAEPAVEPVAAPNSVAGVETVGGRKRRKSSRKSRKGGRKSRKHR